MSKRVGKAWRAQITHCPRGHAYTPDNTYHARQKGTGGPMRQCVRCRRARDRKRRK